MNTITNGNDSNDSNDMKRDQNNVHIDEHYHHHVHHHHHNNNNNNNNNKINCLKKLIKG